jgi:hypothetical protein
MVYQSMDRENFAYIFWKSRVQPKRSFQVPRPTDRNLSRPTRADRPGAKNQQAYIAAVLPSSVRQASAASTTPARPEPLRPFSRVQRYPIPPAPSSPELGREGRAGLWREPSLSASCHDSPRRRQRGGRAVEVEPAAAQAAEPCK